MDISTGEIYAPMFELREGCSDLQAVFCVDRQKRNLLALIGDYDLSELNDLPLAADINEYMDTQTREHLRKMPLEFMKYWALVSDGQTPVMLQSLDPGYIDGMHKRAAQIQRNMLVAERNENVTRVNFRRTF